MSRTVAALYDSRAEAELARARLISAARPKSARIIGKDTAAAVDGLEISQADADHYRQALLQGAHLLVAQVPKGASAKRVIAALEESIGEGMDDGLPEIDESLVNGFRVEDRSAIAPAEALADAPPRQAADRPPAETRLQQVNDQLAPPSDAADETVPAKSKAQGSKPAAPESVRSADPGATGGARVRAFTRDAPVEEHVVLHDEAIEVEARPSEQRLSESEIEAGGLFKERVFEFTEMREEPVVTKVPVVREEIIVRKTLSNRRETIRDTVRQTQIEVEDLPEDASSAFFGRGQGEAADR